MKHHHPLPMGAERADGGIRFRLWAPQADAVTLVLEAPERHDLPMEREADGWHALTSARARPGTRYRYRVGDLVVPDPASRYQPEDVHGPSEVIDPDAYDWRDSSWRGRPWEEIVIYELHTGTFSRTGDFAGIEHHLDHLATLGVTAIELLPVADFAGARNWGYDGVLLYAPDSRYGRPEDLKRLVEASHARGLCIFLDVVYNHFGPDGNYLSVYASNFFTDRHRTPWGAAINFDGPESRPVRDFYVNNALYWLEEFQFDGLRFDAVHAITDDSRPDIITELAERVRRHVGDKRHVHLILENDKNQARYLKRAGDGRPRLHTAQWNDDIHHALRVVTSGQTGGYYADYADEPARRLGRALSEGFVYQGDPSAYRDGVHRGELSAQLPPTAFVSFIQNHDQVGNDAFGTRIAKLAGTDAIRAAAATYLLGPQVPMLFQGEEWGAEQPFAFFCEFGPDLAEAVRKGRREEFAKFPEFADPKARERIPDPTAPETYEGSKLDWSAPERQPHAAWLRFYRDLLSLRAREIAPRLRGMGGYAGQYRALAEKALEVNWTLGEGSRLMLRANYGDRPVDPGGTPAGELLFATPPIGGASSQLPPHSAAFYLDRRRRPMTATRRDTRLASLAERIGIAEAYVDAWGERRSVSDETLRTLAGALGMAEGSPTAAAVDERTRGRLLPPVLVVEEGRPVEIDRPPAGEPVRVAWRVVTETGEVRAGKIDPRPRSRGRRAAARLQLDRLPHGYHRLEVAIGGASKAATLIVAPTQAFFPEAWAQGRRDWALSAQLYSLRSERNWGIGDFTDLADLGRAAAQAGASAIGLNPLHALFPARPDQVSPYSPSSRLFLNPVYIDVAAVPEFAACDAARGMVDEPAFKAALARARGSELVDYAAVWALKRSVLEALHRELRARRIETGAAHGERGGDFARFVAEGGETLARFATFEALQDHFHEGGRCIPWRAWPAPYRDPASADTHAFAAEHAARVEFSQYLQWEADRQLAAAAQALRAAGMSVGLYRDLAVGVDPNGAEAWADQNLLAPGASVGAPPDIYNTKGQDWGLTPFNPLALAARAYDPFVATVRANMRHAGALRIDHVIGMKRLWWVPRNQGPHAGAYVAYPLDDLLGIIALESRRNRCLVVGEDLGTVPEGFREELKRRGILSYRLLLFEREEGDGQFIRPEEYPPLAAAAVSTHDLATLRGLWQGRDLEWRRELGLYPSTEHAEKDMAYRDDLRRHLRKALREDAEAAGAADVVDDDPAALAAAAHRFLTRSASRLLLVQVEDLLGQLEQMNLPGTVDEHPNWRRKLDVPIDRIFSQPLARRLVALLAAVRREESDRE